VAEGFPQKIGDSILEGGMAETGRRAHENVTVGVGFDAALHFEQFGVGADLFPAREVERVPVADFRKFEDRTHCPGR
jgi:hypothetical protein